MVQRLMQLFVSCIVLGIGVAFLLRSTLGSDGYSTLVNGASLSTGVPFLVVNCLVGVALIAMAWTRGTRPGLGTIVQPALVGLVVSIALALLAEPTGPAPRALLLAAAFLMLAIGVAGYLGSQTGAGPAEAAALAWDPPVPFRWSYSIVQGGGALGGWLLGADIGPGTLLVVFALGPVVDLMLRRIPALDRVPALAVVESRDPATPRC